MKNKPCNKTTLTLKLSHYERTSNNQSRINCTNKISSEYGADHFRRGKKNGGADCRLYKRALSRNCKEIRCKTTACRLSLTDSLIKGVFA